MKHVKLFEEFTTTLDNGGIPFVVSTNDGVANVYMNNLHYRFEEMFSGKDSEGGDENSAILLRTDNNRYVFIGEEVYEFTAPEKITKFWAPIGNSGVPYPIAMSETRIYFMLDKVHASIDDFPKDTDWPDAYGAFYQMKDLDKQPFEDVKYIEGDVYDKLRTNEANEEDERLNRIRHFQGSVKDLDDWLRSKIGETNPYKDTIMVNGPHQGQADKSLPYQDFQNGDSDLVKNRHGRQDS